MTAPKFDKSRSAPQVPSGANVRHVRCCAWPNWKAVRRQDDFPELYHDPSFWGMFVTQFFGAFNDNLFKQLVLLLSIAAVGGLESRVARRCCLRCWSARCCS